MDVADEDDGHVGRLGEAEIGDVVGAQIDLGGAAGAFDEDEIGVGRQFVESRQHLGQQAAARRAK